MTNIYKYEFKTNLKNVAIWLVCLLGVSWIFINFYKSAEGDIAQFNKFLSGYPEGALKAMQFDLEAFFSFTSFYSSVLLYANLCFAIEASILAYSIFTKELKLKLGDYLYSKPVKRMGVLWQKYLAGISVLFIEFVVYLLISLLIAKNSLANFDTQKFVLINLSSLFTMLIFYSFSTFLACISNKWRNPSTRGLVIGLIFFAVKMITNIGETGDFTDYLKFISFFDYTDPRYLAMNNFYSVLNLCLLGLVVVVSLILGFNAFKKKDLQGS